MRWSMLDLLTRQCGGIAIALALLLLGHQAVGHADQRRRAGTALGALLLIAALVAGVVDIDTMMQLTGAMQVFTLAAAAVGLSWIGLTFLAGFWSAVIISPLRRCREWRQDRRIRAEGIVRERAIAAEAARLASLPPPPPQPAPPAPAPPPTPEEDFTEAHRYYADNCKRIDESQLSPEVKKDLKDQEQKILAERIKQTLR